jgi:hypothetical protein
MADTEDVLDRRQTTEDTMPHDPVRLDASNDTVRDDTVRDDTVRDDTVRDDTVRDDTVRDDTVRDDAVLEDTDRGQPRPDGDLPAPVGEEHDLVVQDEEPAAGEPPAGAEFQHVEPARDEPAREESAREESAREESAREESERAELPPEEERPSDMESPPGDEAWTDETEPGTREPVAELSPGDVAAEPVSGLWPSDAADGLRERWREIQLRFLDDPRAATVDADNLIGEAIEALTGTLSTLRSDLAEWRSDEGADTEVLRVAVQRYRQFLDRVLSV